MSARRCASCRRRKVRPRCLEMFPQRRCRQAGVWTSMARSTCRARPPGPHDGDVAVGRQREEHRSRKMRRCRRRALRPNRPGRISTSPDTPDCRRSPDDGGAAVGRQCDGGACQVLPNRAGADEPDVHLRRRSRRHQLSETNANARTSMNEPVNPRSSPGGDQAQPSMKPAGAWSRLLPMRHG